MWASRGIGTVGDMLPRSMASCFVPGYSPSISFMGDTVGGGAVCLGEMILAMRNNSFVNIIFFFNSLP